MIVDQRSERSKGTEAYLRRIALVLSQDPNLHYSEVFKRWEFVPNSRECVDFHKAMCGLCKNTFLRNLFLIKPRPGCQKLIPPSTEASYKVGSLCVQNFCRQDEKGNLIPLSERVSFLRKIKKKKFKEFFFANLKERLDQIDSELLNQYPRLLSIKNQINQSLEHKKQYRFQTFNDMIVIAVVLKYKIKQMMRYFFKPPSIKANNAQLFWEMEFNEVNFYSKCYKAFRNKSYPINDYQATDKLDQQKIEEDSIN